MVVSGPRSVWIATARRLAHYAIQQGPLLICTSMCLRTEDARDPGSLGSLAHNGDQEFSTC